MISEGLLHIAKINSYKYTILYTVNSRYNELCYIEIPVISNSVKFPKSFLLNLSTINSGYIELDISKFCLYRGNFYPHDQ